MVKTLKFSFLLSLSFSMLSACGTATRIDVTEGQYWQRASVAEAAYAQGPKAQQMLNMDIAACVSELRELERLGQLRNAIPANPHTHQVISKDELALETYEEPERQRYLLSEHGNYHDFETCMVAKGWERVKYVPFDVAHRARENYLINHVAMEPYNPRMPDDPKTQDDDPNYNHLNG